MLFCTRHRFDTRAHGPAHLLRDWSSGQIKRESHDDDRSFAHTSFAASRTSPCVGRTAACDGHPHAAYPELAERPPGFVHCSCVACRLQWAGRWIRCHSSGRRSVLWLRLPRLFYLAGGMGAGDVKLIAAAGCSCWLAWHLAPLLVWTRFSAGGMMALATGGIVRGQACERRCATSISLAEHHRDAGLTPHPELHVAQRRARLRLPYGVAIACGCRACASGLQMGPR